MKYVLSIVTLLIINKNCLSQSLDPIATDRPDQTESPFIVPEKYFQFEIGFMQEQVSSNEKTWVYPNALIKYGLTQKTELRLILDVENNRIFGKNSAGLNPVVVGFKTNLLDEKGIIPKTSFIGHLSIPGMASSNKKSTYYAPAFRFVMQHTISKHQTLSYNLGSEWDGFMAEPTFIYTLASGFSFSDKLGGYIELYGFAPQKQAASHSWDAGFTYLINNDVQLDVHGGSEVTRNAPDYFIGGGISFRFK